MTTTESAGARLVAAILDDLAAEGLELDAREAALLDAAARQLDAVEALERDIAQRGYLIDGKLNVAVSEARQGRTALARLLGAIDLPDSRRLAELRARRAAEARWRRQTS